MAFVRQIMTFIDDTIAGAAEATFGAIAGNYGVVITMLATLAVAFYGLGVTLGMFNVRTGDIFQIILRIVLVLTFGLAWPNFEIIYLALTSTADALVTALFSAAGGSAIDAIDSAEQFAKAAQDTSASVIRAEGSITRGLLGAVMYILLAALQAVYILIAGFAKIMIGILVGLAPFAIGATVFTRTQFLFEAWLSSLIGYFMYPVAAAGVMGFVATVANEVFGTSSDASLIGITGVVVIILVGLFALRAVPQIAANITGQLNLAGIAPEALQIVSRPIRKSGHMAVNVAGHMGRGSSSGTQDKAQKLSISKFTQRRRDMQFARDSNKRLRSTLASNSGY